MVLRLANDRQVQRGVYGGAREAPAYAPAADHGRVADVARAGGQDERREASQETFRLHGHRIPAGGTPDGRSCVRASGAARSPPLEPVPQRDRAPRHVHLYHRFVRASKEYDWANECDAMEHVASTVRGELIHEAGGDLELRRGGEQGADGVRPRADAYAMVT